MQTFFVQTYQKFAYCLNNQTNNYLPIDILDSSTKKRLFIETLIEIEILVLDLTEINLDALNIKKLLNQIILDLIKKITYNFTQELHDTNKFTYIKSNTVYNQLFIKEHSLSIYQILLYLLFGANIINKQIFPFYYLTTPFNHVRLLFENIIIQLSNIVILNLLEYHNSIQRLSEFLIKNRICHHKYQSIRAISLFRNNLVSYYWLYNYIYYPYSIYCCSYKTCIFSRKGIICKSIYLNRINKYNQLSKYQLISILYLEIQDFIIPKIHYIILLIGQLILYITGEFINQIIKIFSQTIIYKINENQR